MHKFLIAPAARKSSVNFWLSLSFAFAIIYGLIALQKAFSNEYVIQDDARQHVFWMRRFIDPDLFPNDLIADYFQSVAPWGYSTFYRSFAIAGIDPVLLSKLLPIVLGLITTAYSFRVCLQILPLPAVGFVGTLLLNQAIWVNDDLLSGTPRAFIYPLFLAFLYYLLRRSLLPCLAAIVLQGLFYPQYVFIAAGVLLLQLLRWGRGRLSFTRDRRDYWFCAATLGAAVLVMLPYALTPSEFGSIVTVAEARQMPEFSSSGRSAFFNDNPWVFWLSKSRSGISLPSIPPLIWTGVLLPILLRHPARFPLAQQVTSKVALLPHLALAALGMFLAAHAFLFKLHLPSRYTKHSLRIVLALAAAIALVILLDAALRWMVRGTRSYRFRRALVFGVTALLGTILLLSPLLESRFAKTAYVVGEAPGLYKFFARQPKDILIASVADEARNLPTFSQRSTLVSREYAIPYHTGYYSQFRQRALDLIEAQYSPNPTRLRRFIQKYDIDFWLLEENTFTPEYLSETWINQYRPLVIRISKKLEQGMIPALTQVPTRCIALRTRSVEDEVLVVLQASCIVEAFRS